MVIVVAFNLLTIGSGGKSKHGTKDVGHFLKTILRDTEKRIFGLRRWSASAPHLVDGCTYLEDDHWREVVGLVSSNACHLPARTEGATSYSAHRYFREFIPDYQP